MDRSRIIVGFTALIFIISVILLTTTGSSFLPAFNEGTDCKYFVAARASLEESEKAGIEAQRYFSEYRSHFSVVQDGRAELAEHFFGGKPQT